MSLFSELKRRNVFYDRDYEAALGYLDQWPANVLEWQLDYVPKASLYGITHNFRHWWRNSAAKAGHSLKIRKARSGRKDQLRLARSCCISAVRQHR